MMINLFRNVPKKGLIAVATVLTVFGVAASVHAWSPSRPTYTMAVPADHVTFNSITDNPREGDERAFFEVKDAANLASDGFLHTATVKDGEELLIRAYVHNDAASNLDTVSDGKGGFVGVATGTKIRVWLPSVADKTLRLNAYIDAANASPAEVADSLDLAAPNSNDTISVSYVPGSAVAYNNAHTAKDANGNPIGMPLSDEIVGANGAALGFATANGVFPGCLEYANVVTIRVKVHVNAPALTAEKYVANIGDKAWSKSVTSQAGSKVHYELRFRNTGNDQLSNVVARDILPSGVAMVPGSAKLFNNNFQNGVALSDGVTSDGGVSIGAYGPLSAQDQANGLYSAEVDFDATLPNSDALQCGQNKLTNTGQFLTGGMDATDTADVIVNKVCANTASYTCNLFHVTPGDNRTVTVDQFNQSANNGATFNFVSINWGDNSSALQTNTPIGKTHQYASVGNYTISATAHFTVNGADATNTNASCTQTVSFTTTPTPPTTPRPAQLVNTGAGDVATLFAAVAVASAFAYRLFLGRRITE
jgi:uncharacterized repeat protein (TIGR01451 family)